jgi:1,2-diacylglycerol 3-alpha-glucosyltransferase
MRIALVTDSFLPQTNGVTMAVLELSKALASRGHKIFILAPSYPKNPEFSHRNVTVKRFASIPAPFYGGFRIVLPAMAVKKFLKAQKIEIVHVNTPLSLGIQDLLAGKSLKIPLVETYHTFMTHPSYLKHMHLNHDIGRFLVQSFLNLFHNAFDLVVCWSYTMKQELVNSGLKKSSVILPLAINLRSITSPKRTLLRKKPVVLFVGRIAYEKNLPLILESFALVLKRVPSAVLQIAGDGPQLQEIKQKVTELGIEDNVLFIGIAPRKSLLKIYASASVFVNATDSETGPITLIEAMANGLPCVSVEGKGIPIVKSGINGFIAKQKDAASLASSILKILMNPKMNGRMSKAALRTSKEYDMKTAVKSWEEVYRTVAHK